jgi:hypothetical protein
MKTGGKGEVKRVSDYEASKLVDTGRWEYVAKWVWKEKRIDHERTN